MKKDIITDFVLNNIKEGKYKPGCKIMSEGDMAQRFGVSKITVRAALDELVKKEIIYKKKRCRLFCFHREKADYSLLSEKTLY